jgi:hypothetical protein
MYFIRDITDFFRDSFDFLGSGKTARLVFFACLLVPPLLILALFVAAPFFRAPYEKGATVTAVNADADPSLFSLKLEENFLRSQLAEAKSDSIHLVVDLEDSSCNLQVRGVKIRECRISRYRVSRAVRRIAAGPGILEWLDQPFHARKQWGTIPKAPIKIRKAPRDTTEANRTVDQAVPVENADVGFAVLFDRNLSLEILQAEGFSFTGFFRQFWYRIRGTGIRFREEWDAVLHGHSPRHSLHIQLVMPRSDAKAIYRALPKNAGLVLRIPPPKTGKQAPPNLSGSAHPAASPGARGRLSMSFRFRSKIPRRFMPGSFNPP